MKEENTEIPGEDSLSLLVTAEDHESFRRMDHFLAEKLPAFSRSLLKKLFERGEIYLVPSDLPEGTPGKKLSLSKLPPAGSVIGLSLPPPIPSSALPENIPLEILYEDEHLLFINKPQGLVTHPAPGNYTGTLVNALLYHCPDLKGIGGVARPGIVHRLDKGTSGVMVVAKTGPCHEGLVLSFSSHAIERIYQALVVGDKGAILSQGKLDSPIGRHPNNRFKMATPVTRGKRAVTHFKTLSRWDNMALMEFRLETGRTHQIRVHSGTLLKAPILMDPLYGKPRDHWRILSQILGLPEGPVLTGFNPEEPYPFLHARLLGIVHPITKEKLVFEVPPPPPFRELLEALA